MKKLKIPETPSKQQFRIPLTLRTKFRCKPYLSFIILNNQYKPI